MICEYLDRAMEKAVFDVLDDGTIVGEVPPLQGVLATAPTKEACRKQLVDVIEGWILVRVSRGLDIPSIDGLTISVNRPVQ